MNKLVVIDNQVEILNNKLAKLTEYLVNEEDYNHDSIHHESFELNKYLMKLKLKLELLQLEHTDDMKVIDRIKYYNERVKFFTKTLDTINDFNNTKDMRQQSKSLKLLTTINMVALPLAIITGYFGMNFKSMGNITHGKGVLSSLHGQKLVFFLFFVSVIAMVILTNMVLK